MSKAGNHDKLYFKFLPASWKLRGVFDKIKPPKTLSNRLVAANILVLLMALIVMDFSVYFLITERLLNDQDERLELKAANLESATRLWGESKQTFGPEFIHGLVDNELTDETVSEPVYFKVYDKQNGALLALSSNLDTERVPLKPDDFAKASQGQKIISSDKSLDGRGVRKLTLPLQDSLHNIIAIVQVVQSSEVVERLRLLLIIVLILSNLLAVMVAYFAGRWLTNRELKPFNNLVSRLQQLDENNLNLRIPSQNSTIELEFFTGAFNQMASRLEDSFKTQQSMLADVSHELRTPLTAMRGQLEVMLLDPELKGEVRQDAMIVREEANRLTRLVTNLLTGARAEAGLLAPQNNLPVELDSLLVETVRQAHFLKPGVHLVLKKLEQIQVSGDVDLLKQLFLNLLDNALGYSLNGGEVSLELSCSTEPPKCAEVHKIEKNIEKWAVFKVCDTGPGIDPQDLPHIFERRYRSKNAINRQRQGSGLGLYISCLVAQRHNGYITAESNPGKGTCFSVWLPALPKSSC